MDGYYIRDTLGINNGHRVLFLLQPRIFETNRRGGFEGEVGINLIDIGGKRIFACDSCGQTQVRIRKNEYVKIRHDIKTRH
jgi:hypothetical protein